MIKLFKLFVSTLRNPELLLSKAELLFSVEIILTCFILNTALFGFINKFLPVAETNVNHSVDKLKTLDAINKFFLEIFI
jgi:hypothetical protein